MIVEHGDLGLSQRLVVGEDECNRLTDRCGLQ